ncbi:hypothetical protein D3C75_1021220 [compost metagenome]
MCHAAVAQPQRIDRAGLQRLAEGDYQVATHQCVVGQHPVRHGDTQAAARGIQGQVVEVEHYMFEAALGRVLLCL